MANETRRRAGGCTGLGPEDEVAAIRAFDQQVSNETLPSQREITDAEKQLESKGFNLG